MAGSDRQPCVSLDCSLDRSFEDSDSAIVKQRVQRLDSLEDLDFTYLDTPRSGEFGDQDNMTFLDAVSSLAGVRERQGLFSEAAGMYGIAAAGEKRRLGITHPQTLNTLFHYAECLQRQAGGGSGHHAALSAWAELIVAEERALLEASGAASREGLRDAITGHKKMLDMCKETVNVAVE